VAIVVPPFASHAARSTVQIGDEFSVGEGSHAPGIVAGPVLVALHQQRIAEADRIEHLARALVQALGPRVRAIEIAVADVGKALLDRWLGHGGDVGKQAQRAVGEDEVPAGLGKGTKGRRIGGGGIGHHHRGDALPQARR
jgi:hypothetical protein